MCWRDFEPWSPCWKASHTSTKLRVLVCNLLNYLIYNVVVFFFSFFFPKNRCTELKNRTAPTNSVNRNSVFTCFGAVFGFGFLETKNSVTELFGAVLNRTAFCTPLVKSFSSISLLRLSHLSRNLDPRKSHHNSNHTEHSTQSDS